MAIPAWQNPLDWITQAWNIALGRKVDPCEDAWLLGDLGEPGENAESFIARVAKAGNLSVLRPDSGSGLIDSFEPWGFEVPPAVAEFYRHTSDYHLEAESSWNPVFGSFGYLVSALFSRRVQQLNLPAASEGQPVVFKSEIVFLVDEARREERRIWIRSRQDSGQIVFYGVYGLCRIPCGDVCIKAVFPLPHGNATVVFRINCDPAGGVELLSSGQNHGDPGFYFLVRDRRGQLWKHYLPKLRESIVFPPGETPALVARHTMCLGSRPFFRMHYHIRRKPSCA